ncbi:MAG: hypothetical protein KBE09_00080 [Candidatus Pacebacteria bacterium]|nr:hypothetical protein [Candidatus Paceibacterota bacterium]
MIDKKVVVIAGPTASGESTFTKEFVLAYPNFERAVSATTRRPRMNEEEGIDYYFMTKEQFFENVQNGNIPEHTYVKERDAHYGTYLPDLQKKLESGKTVIVNTDLHGARFYKDEYGASTIFIKPKSMQTLYDRLIRRDPTITREEVITRLINASQEILEAEHKYDFTVFNDDGEFAETMMKINDILAKQGYDV